MCKTVDAPEAYPPYKKLNKVFMMHETAPLRRPVGWHKPEAHPPMCKTVDAPEAYPPYKKAQ